MTRKDAERQKAIEKLRLFIKPGDRIFTILRSVSRSGMSRTIDLVAMRDGEPVNIGFTAAKNVTAALSTGSGRTRRSRGRLSTRHFSLARSTYPRV